MTLKELEAQVKEINDIEAIKQLQYRYINSLILTQWDNIMDLFAQDCTLDLGDGSRGSLTFARGRDDISRYFRERVSTAHIGREGNFVVHPLISVNGDTASGTWISYFMHIHARTGEPLHWMQGIYDCKYVKEKGQWKFSVLKWRSRLKYITSQADYERIRYEA